MSNFYESDQAVAEYLLFHYGEDDLVMPWPDGPRSALGFPARCVSECLLRDRLPPGARALDLGCAVGRSSFELTRTCASVIGMDRSARFIEAAERLRSRGSLDFSVVDEGGLRRPAVARLPVGTHPNRVRFTVGDALDLREDLGLFEVVLAANLIDRVPDPARLLASLPGLLLPGGQLILTSPYTWLESYTPPDRWLCAGGRRTSDGLPERLAGLRLAGRVDLPFLIREHARKFQWSVAEATVWTKDRDASV